MNTINVEARINLPKEGLKQYMRVCKAGMKCTYSCEHRNPHLVNLACFTRCCDVSGKDVRCISED